MHRLHSTSLPTAALLALLLICPPATAKKAEDTEGQRQKTRQTMEIVGFTSDGREVLLKVDDENRGWMFQVRDSKSGELVQAEAFREETEKKAWRKVKKGRELSDAWVDGPENPKKGVTLMTAEKGGELCVYMMKGEAIKLYGKVPLLKNKKGESATSFVKQTAWDERGKYAAVVYHQALTDLLEWEGDFVHTFKFKSYKVDFGDGEGGDDDDGD